MVNLLELRNLVELDPGFFCDRIDEDKWRRGRFRKMLFGLAGSMSKNDRGAPGGGGRGKRGVT